MSSVMVEADGLVKTFGSVRALDGLSLRIEQGTIFGLLGPNGAGKTTSINVFTTLVRADGGTARVAGYDLAREAAQVRGAIGVTGQFAALDENLTGLENLVLFGRLMKLGKRKAHARAVELLERFDLAEAGARRTGTYSGGMRRRLDLAASLTREPRVLFLDEPTTGLDPHSRLGLWDTVRELRDNGITVLLTTQYLAEADELADRIAVIDHGRVVAEGTAAELKRRAGGSVCHVTLPDETTRARVAAELADLGEVSVLPDGVSLPAAGPETLVAVLRRFDADAAGPLADVELEDIGLRRPTLDDVFLRLTGKDASAGTEARASV